MKLVGAFTIRCHKLIVDVKFNHAYSLSSSADTGLDNAVNLARFLGLTILKEGTLPSFNELLTFTTTKPDSPKLFAWCMPSPAT
ncbi:MAG: hypothetical protein QXQ50_03260 [Candidatus Bathyarchaeia archaeon]